MEISSIIGLVAGFVFILLGMLFAGNFEIVALLAFVDPASVMITVGGTVAATLISFSTQKVITAMKASSKIFKIPDADPIEAINNIIKYANLARKEGILALEESVGETNDAFLKKGIMLIVDGTDPELTKSILETEMAYVQERHSEVRAVWDYIASAGPAWGMIGTLLGLILMLKDMQDVETLGPKMAVALITTFYGSVIANYIATPISNKLKLFSGEEIVIKEVLVEGMLSIQAGENPRIIEEKLKSFLAPALRNVEPEKGSADREDDE